jgi:hypothetical protein
MRAVPSMLFQHGRREGAERRGDTRVNFTFIAALHGGRGAARTRGAPRLAPICYAITCLILADDVSNPPLA